MNIPDSVFRDHFVPKDFVKPVIEVGHYFLEWDKASYGIPTNEIADLRKFIGQLESYMTAVLFAAASGIRGLAAKVSRSSDRARLIEVFSPLVTVSYRKERFSYVLNMEVDGASTIERVEQIKISEKSGQSTGLELKSSLGVLLFRR